MNEIRMAQPGDAEAIVEIMVTKYPERFEVEVAEAYVGCIIKYLNRDWFFPYFHWLVYVYTTDGVINGYIIWTLKQSVQKIIWECQEVAGQGELEQRQNIQKSLLAESMTRIIKEVESAHRYAEITFQAWPTAKMMRHENEAKRSIFYLCGFKETSTAVRLNLKGAPEVFVTKTIALQN